MYQEQMTKYGYVPANHEAPAWFPVALEDMGTINGEKVPGFKAVVRQDTRQVIHVATDSYTLVPNETVFATFDKALAESKLPIDNMMIGRDMSHEGRRTFVQYLLPDVTEQVNGADLALRFTCFNSYDGSRPVGFSTGHYSFACANTALNGNALASYSLKHVGEIDIGEIVENLVAAAEQYHSQLIAMRDWPKIPVSDTQAIEIFEQLPGSTKRLQGELLPAWLKAKDDTGQNGGANLWAAYNVLTYWSSHGDGYKEATKAYARNNREERIAELIESDHWQAMVN